MSDQATPLHMVILIEADDSLHTESRTHVGPVLVGAMKDFGWPWKDGGWIEDGPRYLVEAATPLPRSNGLIVGARRLYGPEPQLLPSTDS